MFAQTPPPPYYAVIFTAKKTETLYGYEETALKLIEMVQNQPGFLGVESADGSCEINSKFTFGDGLITACTEGILSSRTIIVKDKK